MPEDKDKCISPREYEIISLLAEGLHQTEIAKHLFISIKTVQKHVHSALLRSKAKTTHQLVAMIVRGDLPIRFRGKIWRQCNASTPR